MRRCDQEYNTIELVILPTPCVSSPIDSEMEPTKAANPQDTYHALEAIAACFEYPDGVDYLRVGMRATSGKISAA